MKYRVEKKFPVALCQGGALCLNEGTCPSPGGVCTCPDEWSGSLCGTGTRKNI